MIEMLDVEALVDDQFVGVDCDLDLHLLLGETDVMMNSIGIDRIAGVYFLIRNDLIVYIGKTKNAYYRIGQHIQEGKKVFDSFCFIYCEDDLKSSDMERDLIAKFRPPYNVVHNK